MFDRGQGQALPEEAASEKRMGRTNGYACRLPTMELISPTRDRTESGFQIVSGFAGTFVKSKIQTAVSSLPTYLSKSPYEIIYRGSQNVDGIASLKAKRIWDFLVDPSHIDHLNQVPRWLHLGHYLIWPTLKEDFGLPYELVNASPCPCQAELSELFILRLTHV